MTKRSTWLSLLASLGVMLSMALATLVTNVSAAAPRHAAHVSAKKHLAKKCTKRPKATGLIKFSDWQFPDTMNGFTGGGLAITALIGNATGEGLTTYDNKAREIPDMLTTLPTLKNGGIKDGGKTIVLHMKSGLRWSNGAASTSKDIKFGWKVNMDKLTGPACEGTCDKIARIDTPSKYMAVLHMKEVYAAAVAYALPPVEITKWPGGWNNDPHQAAVWLTDAAHNFEGPNYPTNGAFQIVEWVKDDRVVMHPMKYYHIMNCGAPLQNLIFAFYSSKESMIAAAASKQTDMTQNYTSADLPNLSKNAGAYKVHADPGFIFEHLELNEDPTYKGKPNPLASTKVRVALALATDKLGSIRSAQSLSTAQAKAIMAWTPLVNTPSLKQPFADSRIQGQWDPIAKKYQLNTGFGQALADAKKLLAQTPYKDGFSLDTYTTTGNAVRAAQLQVYAANWKKLGVTMVPNFVPASKLFGGWDSGGILHHGDFQVADFAFLGSPDPDQLKLNLQSKYIDRRQSTHSATNGNDAAVTSRTIDVAFNKAASSFDKRVRQKYYSQIQVEINKNAYWIPLYSRPQIATDDGRIKNFSNNPTQVGQTWNVWAWARVH